MRDCKIVTYALVSSRLDYCNSLYAGLSQSALSPLQLVWNAAAELLTGTWKRDYITPVLHSPRWLLVSFRNSFKIFLFVYKALRGIISSSISDLWNQVIFYHNKSWELLDVSTSAFELDAIPCSLYECVMWLVSLMVIFLSHSSLCVLDGGFFFLFWAAGVGVGVGGGCSSFWVPKERHSAPYLAAQWWFDEIIMFTTFLFLCKQIWRFVLCRWQWPTHPWIGSGAVGWFSVSILLSLWKEKKKSTKQLAYSKLVEVILGTH